MRNTVNHQAFFGRRGEYKIMEVPNGVTYATKHYSSLHPTKQLIHYKQITWIRPTQLPPCGYSLPQLTVVMQLCSSYSHRATVSVHLPPLPAWPTHT